MAQHLRDIADFWNDSIERWTYTGEAELCLQECVRGYYVRITPPEVADAASPTEGFVPIKNRPPGQSHEPVAQMISHAPAETLGYPFRLSCSWPEECRGQRVLVAEILKA